MYALVLAIIAGYSLLIALLARWGTLVTSANRHIHVLPSVDIQRTWRRAVRAASRAGAGDLGLAAATLQIARVARTLLADFPTRFAGDPCVAAATALARHLGS
jgi:hypothetical protein